MLGEPRRRARRYLDGDTELRCEDYKQENIDSRRQRSVHGHVVWPHWRLPRCGDFVMCSCAFGGSCDSRGRAKAPFNVYVYGTGTEWISRVVSVV